MNQCGGITPFKRQMTAVNKVKKNKKKKRLKAATVKIGKSFLI